MKFDNYPELINHHNNHVKIDWAITDGSGIPKKSNDKEILLAYTDSAENNLEHIIKTKLVDLIHPVGSVILTTSTSFNPATQFGGTWTKWTDGYLKVDTSPNATATGSYNITTDQLPSHGHPFQGDRTGTESADIKLKAIDNKGEAQSPFYGEIGQQLVSGADSYSYTFDYSSDNTYSSYYHVYHNHQYTPTGTVKATGGGKEFKPKYYAVIAWQRTA